MLCLLKKTRAPKGPLAPVPRLDQEAMEIISNFLLLFALLLASACVSTGVKDISKPAPPARLEAKKSSQADVIALLGQPVIVTYGDQGQETWNYYYVTEYPQLLDFIPVVNAASPGSQQQSRVLTITFDRGGVAQDLQLTHTTIPAKVYPY